MTEQHEPPNGVAPAPPAASAGDPPQAPTVRASPTEATAGSETPTSAIPATPFERAALAAAPSPPRMVGDGVLPFVKPAPVAVPAPVAPPAAPPPEAPPVAGQTPDAPPVAGQTPDAPVVAGQTPEAPAVASPAPAAPAAAPPDEPRPQAPASAPASSPAALPGPVLSDGSSPWTVETKLDANLLPSSSLGFLPSASAEEESAKSAPSEHGERAHGSRTLLIVGLVVAALALAGGIIYIATRPSSGGEGPTSVLAGSDSAQVGLEPAATGAATATATGSESASARAVAPRPIAPKAPTPPPTKTAGGYYPSDL